MKKLKAVKEFAIDRSKWHTGDARNNRRGDAIIDSALYVQTTKRMCCLGFFGAACGLSKTKMTGHGYLTDLNGYDFETNQIEEFFEDRLPHYLQKNLARINDDDDMTLPEKEKNIKDIFSKRGIKVKFVGKLLP